MAYHLGQTPDPPASLEAVLARQDELLHQFKLSEERRKWAMIAGIAGAVFAAFRLGILAVPKIRERAWRSNPRRRRR